MEPLWKPGVTGPQRAARAVAGLVCVAYAILLANSAFLQIRSAVFHPEPGDVSAYFAAVQARNAHADFYDVKTLTQIGTEREVPGGVRAFLYPPVFVQAISPFTGQSFLHFRIAWILLSTLALFLLFLVTVTLVSEELACGWGYVACASALIFAPFSPIERELFYGQTSILVAALAYLALWSARRRRDVLAAAAVVAGAFVKIYPLALLAVFVLRKRFAICAYAGLGLAFVIAGSIAVGGASDWVRFAALVRHVTSWVPFTLDAPNYSIQAFVQTVALVAAVSLSPGVIVTVSRAAWLASVAAYAVWMGPRLRDCRSLLLLSQVALAFAMLASNVLWNHIFVLLLPGFVYAACWVVLRGAPGKEFWLLVAAFGMVALPDYTTHVGLLTRTPFYLFKPLKLYGLVAYLGLCSRLITAQVSAQRAGHVSSR